MSEVSSPTPSRSPHWPALDGWRGFTIWFAISVHAGYFTAGGVLSLDTFFVLSGFLITGLLLREWQRREGIDLLGVLGAPRTAAPAGALRRARRGRRVRRLRRVAARCSTRVRGDVLVDALLRRQLALRRCAASRTSRRSPRRRRCCTCGRWRWRSSSTWCGRSSCSACSGWRGRRLSATGAVVAVGVVARVGAVASAVTMASLYMPGGDPSRVYYGTDTRAQAMLVGAALAVVVPLHGPLRSRVGADRALDRRRAVGSSSWSCPWFAGDAREIHDVFYGRFGLLAYSVATAVVVWRLTQPSAGWFGRVLESSPLRWVGAISYEMYLWHWPTYLLLTRTAHGARRRLAAGAAARGRRRPVVGDQRAASSGPIRRGVRLRSPRLARSAVVMLAVVVSVGDLRRDRGRRTGAHR